ncbi:MAG TPA: hypothetical protein VIT42_16710, partial [Microlunatus sp.]
MRIGPRRAWVLVLVPVLAAGLLLTVFVIWGGSPAELGDRTAIAATLLAIVGAVAPVVVWALKQRRGAPPVSTSVQVEAAAGLLAERTAATWSQELVRRGIEAPAPVRVRWRWAGGDVTLPEHELASAPARSSDPDPLPAGTGEESWARPILNSGVVTRLHDEVYARLRHGRLVLIGGPGAGKTGAMMLLLMEALQYRDRRPIPDRVEVPVPVWLTLGSWNPIAQGLREWVVATIARDHPYLRAEEFGPDAIAQLFDSARIALFLDGLDEMPEVHRDRAIDLLSVETAGLRVTMTSRPDQYRATMAAGGQLPYTAVVELHPVSPRAAVRYLLDGQVGSARQDWQQVTERLEADPDGVLAQTLNTPLTLSLARAAYEGRAPTELLSSDLASEQALREHLLDQVLVTAYPDPRQRAHATHWLGWIADQMNTQLAGPTRDLRWWDIPGWVYEWRRQLLGAALGGLLCGLATMLWWFIFSYGTVAVLVLSLLTLFGGLAAGLLVALVVGHSGSAFRRQPSLRLIPPRSQRRRRRPGGGLWFGLAAGLSSGLLFGLWVVLQNWQEGVYVSDELSMGVPVGAVAGIVFGLVVGRSGRDPQVMVLRRPTAQDLRRGRRRIVTGGLPAGLGVGVLFVVMFWGGSPVWILFDLAVALVFWIMFGFMFWLVGDLWNHPLA